MIIMGEDRMQLSIGDERGLVHPPPYRNDQRLCAAGTFWELKERKGNCTLLSVIQEDELDDGWSPDFGG